MSDTRFSTFDYSTIHLDVLRKLPVYKLPPSYRLQRDPGNGCLLDPPGYPTYFTQSIYTSSGNSPPRTAKTEEVIAYKGVLYVTRIPWQHGDTHEKRQAKHSHLMRRLWKPLPLTHPRTVAWIRACYGYFAGLYVPTSGSTNVADLVHVGEPLAYRPFDHVREFYHEHELDEDLKTNPPAWGKGGEGDWWERESEKPTPETCRPSRGPHPLNGTWCQHCGWVEPAE